MIDIFIVTTDQENRLYKCLKHLDNSTYKDFIAYCIDNASNKCDVFRLLKSFSFNFLYIRQEEHMYYGPIINKYYRIGSSEFLLQLNDDCYVEPTCIENLVKAIEKDPKIGMAGAKLLYEDRDEINGAVTAFKDNQPYELYLNAARDLPFINKSKYVEGVACPCSLIRRSVWKELNGVDLAYAGGGWEDIDFCLRVREHGYRCWYEATAEAKHTASTTFKRTKEFWEEYERNHLKCIPIFLDRWKNKIQTLPI